MKLLFKKRILGVLILGFLLIPTFFVPTVTLADNKDVDSLTAQIQEKKKELEKLDAEPYNQKLIH